MSTRNACVVAALLFTVIGVSLYAPRASTQGKTLALNEREANEAKRIERFGGEKAYKFFADEIKDLSYEEQHVGAHAFGAALYDVEGVSGLTVCDERFSYGCFHEFLGRAIATLGIASVPKLNQACFEDLKASGLSCQHGIGHGVQAYFGYEENNLSEALDTCAALPGTDPIGGCFGGAFMEYNFQSMLGEQARTRAYNQHFYSPCDSIDAKYKKACFFWQPQWWYAIISHVESSEENVFERMGRACESEEAEGLYRECFEGIGNIVPPAAGFSGRKAAQLCRATSENPAHVLFCLSIAANSIGITKSDVPQEALSVCEGLNEKSKEYCIAYARNEANILLVREPVEI